MQGHQIYKNLARINELPRDEAEATFLDCCGSQAWATQMADARPFQLVGELLKKAEAIWLGLRVADWLEAFAAHPMIGTMNPVAEQPDQSSGWSKDGQAAAAEAADEIFDALVEANRLYEEKFGFIFIVCATGKSPGEILVICNGRLSNDRNHEISIAADEQRKITEIRLGKLLEQ